MKDWRALWLPGVMLLLFLSAAAFRPLLPIDETRYMSVAWEMWLLKGWLEPLTINFAPYHHKPPLLFWLINLSWSLFGVSRWAGLVPPVIAAGFVAALTGMLGKLLFPDLLADRRRTLLVIVGSVPFLIYSTLIMFDLTLCVFVLLSLISAIFYSRKLQLRYAVFLGLCLGMGVLTKGPVAYLYVLFPIIFAPLWQNDFKNAAMWYAGILLALLVSSLPVLCWLVPVLHQASGDFAFWLLWEQTAGRITGNFNAAHVRPLYFYLPLLPLMFAPWLLFPAFWRGLRRIDKKAEGVCFLATWLIPVFVCFSLISGKQPHYLVPLLPGLTILATLALRDIKTKTLGLTVAAFVALVVAGQSIAAQSVFKKYDLSPVAEYMQTHPQHDWAYVQNYHAEMGFLARLQKPVADISPKDLDAWFKSHSRGLALIAYKKPERIRAYHKLMDLPYRGGRLGLFSPASSTPY